MKKHLPVLLIAILFFIGGFLWISMKEEEPDVTPPISKISMWKRIFSYSDEFSKLSDEELVATCTINGYSCSELVRKFNETKYGDAIGPDEIIGEKPAQILFDGGSKSYYLPDGRNVWYDQSLDGEEECDEKNHICIIIDDSFGSITIDYPDGRSLQFDRAGNFVKLEKNQKRKWPFL